MLIELNRFFTTDEVRKERRIPDLLAPELLPLLPFVAELPDGTRLHLESEVDHYLMEFFRNRRLAEAGAAPRARGKPGRRIETQEIALYADELKRQGKTWKDIWKACRQRWPGDDRVKTQERVRGTWNRFFGPNRRKSY